MDNNDHNDTMPSIGFLCSECNQTYKRFADLRKHVKKSHSNKLDELAPLPVKSYPFHCTLCGKNFSHKRNMNTHLKTHQDNVSTDKSGSFKIIKKKCPLCDFIDKYKCNFYNHFNLDHNIIIETEELEFSSDEEFIIWFSNIEKETLTKYVLAKGSTPTKKQYVCHRSGFFKSRSTGQRRLKTQGSKKINGFCPAGIEVSIDRKSDSHKVTFLKTHVGHQNELCHLIQSKDETHRQGLKKKFTSYKNERKMLLNTEESYQHETVEYKKLEEINEVVDHVYEHDVAGFLSEKKKELIDKLVVEINSIRSKEEFAAVERIAATVGPTLEVLREIEKPIKKCTQNCNEIPFNVLPQR